MKLYTIPEFYIFGFAIILTTLVCFAIVKILETKSLIRIIALKDNKIKEDNDLLQSVSFSKDIKHLIEQAENTFPLLEETASAEDLIFSLCLLNFCKRKHKAMVDKGFWPEDKEVNHPEKLMLMVSELSEGLESLRKDRDKKDEHLPQLKNYGVELADLFLRWADYVGKYNDEFQFVEAVILKSMFNETRPPKHGKNF